MAKLQLSADLEAKTAALNASEAAASEAADAAAKRFAAAESVAAAAAAASAAAHVKAIDEARAAALRRLRQAFLWHLPRMPHHLSRYLQPCATAGAAAACRLPPAPAAS